MKRLFVLPLVVLGLLSTALAQTKKPAPPPLPDPLANCIYVVGTGWLCGSGGTSGTGVTRPLTIAALPSHSFFSAPLRSKNNDVAGTCDFIVN